MPNPLESGQPFSLSLANPNPKFRPRKDGDHWFIEFEVSAEEAAHFLDPNINRKGMVIEAVHCEVTHLNPKLAGMMCGDPRFEITGISDIVRGQGVASESATAQRIKGQLNQPENQKQEQELKGGPLAKLAGMMCADQKFWEWLNETSDMEVRDWLEDGIINEKDARNAILYTCGIESRRELDHNPEAARIFHEQIRLPYMNWLERQARVT